MLNITQNDRHSILPSTTLAVLYQLTSLDAQSSLSTTPAKALFCSSYWLLLTIKIEHCARLVTYFSFVLSRPVSCHDSWITSLASRETARTAHGVTMSIRPAEYWPRLGAQCILYNAYKVFRSEMKRVSRETHIWFVLCLAYCSWLNIF